MFRNLKAPPFVPSDANAPKWMLDLEKKRFLSEWRNEQRKRQNLLKKGLPVPPMPAKFEVEQTAMNAELTGYPQIGFDASAFIHKCNDNPFGAGAMEDSASDGDGDADSLIDEPTGNNDEIFRIRQRLRTDANMLRVKPHMPFDLFNKKIDEYIKNPAHLAQLTTNNTVKLYIAASKIDEKGVGLYTATPIPPNTPVAELFGHLQKIETKQFQKIEPLEAPYGFTNNGALMFPDFVNKHYYAIFPAANRDSVCAAYFANYNTEANLVLYRAYTQEQFGSNLGVRKHIRNKRHLPERPRFFLFSGPQPITEHTELCWNYGIDDDVEVRRQNYYHVSSHSLLASQQMVDMYNQLYERNIAKFAKAQHKMMIEKQRERVQFEHDSILETW